MVHPSFHADLIAAGVRPLPLTPELDLRAILTNPDLMRIGRGARLVMEMIFAGVPSLCAALTARIREDRPDAVLAHHICVGARWVCEREGVPIALGVLAPALWLSRQSPVPVLQRTPPSPRPGQGWERGGGWRATLARGAFPVMLPISLWLTDRRINPLRRSLGFGPLRSNCLHDFLAGDANLALWSPHLRPPQPDDPATGLICGFPWYDTPQPSAALDPALEEFVRAGDAPIVFCLGTAASHTAGDFHTLAARAAGRIGRRAILLVGRGVAPPTPADLPTGVIAAEYAPFSLLLPRAAVVVHHGGIGSTAQALRAGKPALVIPHAHDQFNNALLLHRLGVARILPRRSVTVPRLADHLGALLTDSACASAAQALGERLAREDGAAVAAGRLEQIARGALTGSAPGTPPAHR